MHLISYVFPTCFPNLVSFIFFKCVLLYVDQQTFFIHTTFIKPSTEKNWAVQVRISTMNKIRYLLFINREILFFINHSGKDEKVILANVGKDVGNGHCHILLAECYLQCFLCMVWHYLILDVYIL